MATRLSKYGCPPATPAEAALDNLLQQRERLVTMMTSGVLEIEQPVLGRSQYRSMAELNEALRILDGLIGSAGGSTGAAGSDYRRVRRPIYPVAKEY